MDELVRAQKRLGQTLERASIGEDRQLAADVRERGEAFANLLFGTLRMTRIYELNNDTFVKPLDELQRLTQWLIQHLGIVHLVTVEDQVYINDVRIRFAGAAASTTQLGAELRRHNVGGISFHQVLDPPRMLALIAALAAPAAEVERRTALCRQLAAQDVSGVELSGVKRYLLSTEEKVQTEWLEVLQRAVMLVEETWNNVFSGRMFNPLALRRMVVEILAAGIETEGLWESPPGETEHGPHAVRVCRTALAIGVRAGLSDRTLQDLGVAGLVHDIGYTQAAGAAKSSLKEHLAGGALVMLSHRGFHAAKIHRVLGILYHHHAYKDLPGVPSLFGRVLRIAEDYDNLCQPRGGGHPPPTALSLMAGAAGTLYDPTLLQLAINTLGRFPPGTRLQLEDGRQVRVVSLARLANFDRPRVATDGGMVLDLAKTSFHVARVL